ncbi:MAG: FliA/WhiG family RNA polymerase sigma factor [Oscillospiraceae bacterium]|jgi:RNA polymerase sigma factor for flagellar operon FliA|nr:FliA/WhiG family RNA polymerase sigma factor [Oscillospiraceae bacterium]
MGEGADSDKDMWQLYSQTRDAGLRDQIIIRYSGLVKGMVLKMRGVYDSSDADDIINHAMITLIECVDRFDHTKGVKFETFAAHRIRGNVIDFLRKQNWVPRRLRQEAKKVERAFVELGGGDEGEDLEVRVAEHVGMTVDNVRRLMSEVSKFNIVSYEQLVYESLEGGQQDIRDPNNLGDPDGEFLKREFEDHLVNALGKLKERDRVILSLYYSEGLKFREISEVLGVTEARVCQIHGALLKKIRDQLREYLGRR